MGNESGNEKRWGGFERNSRDKITITNLVANWTWDLREREREREDQLGKLEGGK